MTLTTENGDRNSADSVWVPLALAAAAAAYLWHLLSIRASIDSTYSDFFAIPVILLLLVVCTIDTALASVRVRRRRQQPDDSVRTDRRGSWFREPRVRLAVLLLAYVVGFGRIPFIVWSTVFLTVAVAVLEPDSSREDGKGGIVFYSVVVTVSAALSTLLFLGFTQLGARL